MPDITIGDFTESIEINVADGSFLALRDLRSLSTAASKVVAFFRTPVNESGFQSAKFSSTFGKSTNRCRPEAQGPRSGFTPRRE